MWVRRKNIQVESRIIQIDYYKWRVFNQSAMDTPDNVL